MENKKRGLNINAKSFISAIIVVLVLMILTYILSMVVPGGEYKRITDAYGNTVIDTEAGFKYVEGGIPFWKWILSPFLVLGADGSAATIGVIIFMLVIGGAFSCLEGCNLMKYMLAKITNYFGNKRYKLLAVVTLFFMLMGSFIGSFEECVPLVTICVALAVGLGWDNLMGLGMSILAAGCGFAAGISNPFTIGVAQQVAGLPMFSGMWMRVLSFLLIYGILILFLIIYGKKTQRQLDSQLIKEEFVKDTKMDKALKVFAVIIIIGILITICSAFITALQDYTMIVISLIFLISGIISSLIAGMPGKEVAKCFGAGVLGILPAIAMILMATSIKYTLVEAKILDTILHAAVTAAGTMPNWVVILFIYLVVLVMNFFIPSGSAKAVLLMPLLVPLAQVFGISAQLCVLAFAFGDGFSNMFYPTNPVLLISIGLADVSYGKWVKWSWKYQAIILALTCGLLLFGYAIGYK